jgi:hypothetical protein
MRERSRPAWVAELLAALLLGFAVTAQVAARDELPKAKLDAVGIDGAAIAKLVADIRAGKYSNVHSLLVLRAGKLVTE